ncbi:hypothetical protein DES53_11073 [Roseimicrobium gellanilyticum]|uniref:Type II/III secretion system protein n=1 Tax=Roseimicrobium gellanilyticum TaxID=748857 RepID=A0A366HAW4_9BACT|nr:hypothetical protein [Roseimicrobium gellanilyticum]RBP39049.1 hypothetical protein DES53_11073 [Roseimicrobium gellanilyticum]
MHKLLPHFLCVFALGAVCCLPLTGAAQETKPATSTPVQADPQAWTVKVYRYPSEALVDGFLVRERGQLAAPPMPKADASEAEILTFLRRSSDVVTQHLRFETVILPKGSLAAFDPVNQTLVVRTTNAMHERIASMSASYVAKLPLYLTFGIRVMEADGAVLREEVKKCATLADHAATVKRLEELVGQGKAKHLNALRVDTRSGQRAKIQRTLNRTYPTEYSLEDKDQVSVVKEMRPVGPIFEVDPVIGPDGATIDVNLAFDYHHAPPTLRWEPAGQQGARSIESQVIDFHTTKATFATTMLSGMTRMIHVWKPETSFGVPATDVMQAAFLKSDIVSVLPALDNRVETLLKAHGEKVEPLPKGPPTEPSDLPPGMILRSFRVPVTFLSAAASGESAAPAAPADPFAAAGAMASEPRISVRITALEILKSQGINFPAGSSANFNPATGELIVRNTPENMAALEKYIGEITSYSPRVLVSTIHIIQADGATLRKLEADTATISDHSAAWAGVEKDIAAGKVKSLRTARLETRSGQRASFDVIHEHLYVTGVDVSSNSSQSGGKEGEKTVVHVHGNGSVSQAPSYEMEPVGVRFELDPVIGPDGKTIDLNFDLKYDYAAPVLRRDTLEVTEKLLRYPTSGTDFHKAEVTTALTMHDGSARLMGIWKPEGTEEFDKADIMQAAFIRVNLVAVVPDKK